MSDNSLNPKALLEGLYDILKNNGERLDEKAESKAQQRLMGMVHAAQQGEKAASPTVAKIAKSMKKKDVKDFAKTKHKGLPNKVKKSKKVKKESGEPDLVADEELKMFSRKNVGKRAGRNQVDNPWNQLHKRGRGYSSRTRKRVREEDGMEECAGVGIVNKQNSTQDVGSGTLQKNLSAFNLEEAMQDMVNTMMKEGRLRKGTELAVPGIETWDQLDNNNSPYAAYRYGIALAGAPHDSIDKGGPVGGNFVTIGYSDEDRNIIDAAARNMGVSSKKQGNDTSVELPDVNKKSVIATPKRNRYGI
jgi:hypothetical protein